MFKILIFIIASTSFASEGLFPIKDLKTKPGYRNSYYELNGCGSVRIHKTKPYLLTALHCLTNHLDSISPSSVVNLGNHFAFDSISFFQDLTGKTLKDGSKVLAMGHCYTGLDPEVLEYESVSNRSAAFKCATGDWAIIETPYATANQCSPVFKGSPKTLYALGATRVKITRSTGELDLKGNVYTNASAYTLTELMSHQNFVFKDLWQKFVSDFESSLGGKFLLTDGDVLNGMSGGPVLTPDFQLVAVTSTALLPTNVWKFEGAYPLDSGFNFGIHGAIKISEISDQLKKNKLKIETLFDCEQ